MNIGNLFECCREKLVTIQQMFVYYSPAKKELIALYNGIKFLLGSGNLSSNAKNAKLIRSETKRTRNEKSSFEIVQIDFIFINYCQQIIKFVESQVTIFIESFPFELSYSSQANNE